MKIGFVLMFAALQMVCARGWADTQSARQYHRAGEIMPVTDRNGFVYEDRNGNGIPEGDEQGVSGSLVSDGYEVVKTDSQGKFSLPKNPEARFITLTTPSGYEHTTPFYRKPDSGDLSFGLRKSKHPTGRFIQVTDMHAERLDDWAGNLKRYVRNNGLDFIVLTGDLTREYGMDLYALEVNKSTMGTRVVYTIGNHDLVAGDYGEQYFENKFGPVYYSFDIGNTHFIVTPMMPYKPTGASYNLKQVLEWLQKDIGMQPSGKPLVIFNHSNWLWDEACTVSAGDVSIDFRSHNLKAFIYGHYHDQFTTQFDNGIRLYTTSTADKGGRHHCPSASREFSFDVGKEHGVRSETIFTDINNHLVSSAYRKDGKLKIVASAYHFVGKGKELTVRCGEERIPMRQRSSFAWDAELPYQDSDIEVTATFSDGNRISCHTTVDPTLKWVANIGGNSYFTKPVLHDRVIYTASIDDDNLEKCGVHAVDAESGKKIWELRTRNSVVNDIAYSEGKILACDTENILYAIDAKTGKLEWKRPMGIGIKMMFKNGICAQDGIVYAGQSSCLSALRASDGELLWRCADRIRGESSVSTPGLHKGLLHATTAFGLRYALDAGTGKLVWSTERARNPYDYSYSSALFHDGKMYYTRARCIVEADPASGETLREVKTGHHFVSASAPVEKDGVLYVGTGDKGVVAYDIGSLQQKWVYQTHPSLFYTAPYLQNQTAGVASTPTIAGDKVFFGANDGRLYCLGTEAGEYIWSRNLGSPVLGDVLIEGNDLYVSDYAGNLYNFDISSVLKIKHNPQGVSTMRNRFEK
jgi:outer membrane protein assembly factor BamB